MVILAVLEQITRFNISACVSSAYQTRRLLRNVLGKEAIPPLLDKLDFALRPPIKLWRCNEPESAEDTPDAEAGLEAQRSALLELLPLAVLRPAANLDLLNTVTGSGSITVKS